MLITCQRVATNVQNKKQIIPKIYSFPKIPKNSHRKIHIYT